MAYLLKYVMRWRYGMIYILALMIIIYDELRARSLLITQSIVIIRSHAHADYGPSLSLTVFADAALDDDDFLPRPAMAFQRFLSRATSTSRAERHSRYRSTACSGASRIGAARPHAQLLLRFRRARCSAPADVPINIAYADATFPFTAVTASRYLVITHRAAARGPR